MYFNYPMLWGWWFAGDGIADWLLLGPCCGIYSSMNKTLLIFKNILIIIKNVTTEIKINEK